MQSLVSAVHITAMSSPWLPRIHCIAQAPFPRKGFLLVGKTLSSSLLKAGGASSHSHVHTHPLVLSLPWPVQPGASTPFAFPTEGESPLTVSGVTDSRVSGTYGFTIDYTLQALLSRTS